MKKILSLVLVCALALFYAPACLSQGETFIYQLGGFFVFDLPDGHTEGGVLFFVQNNDDMPLFFESFYAPVLDGEGNTLTTATKDSGAPMLVMPGEVGFVWCAFQSDEFSGDQMQSVAVPQADCYGFPESTDASGDLSISDEKCDAVAREDGEMTIRLSAVVTNTSNQERRGAGGYFNVVGVGENPPRFPIAFDDDALLGTLAPGESVTVGVELPQLLLYVTANVLGYEQFDPDELRFTTRAFATKPR